MCCVLPTLNYKRVVVVQPGGFCLWRLETESYFLFPGLPFNSVLIQIVDSSQSQYGFSMITFIPILSSLDGITRLVYLQMRGFSSFPQFWLLRYSWEWWVILLQYGFMGLGKFLLLFSLVGFCTFTCGSRDFAPLHKDRFLDSCLRYSLVDPLFSSHHNTKTQNSCFRFLFLSSSSHRRVQLCRRGESDWTDVTLRYSLTSPTFTSLLDLLRTFPREDIHVWFPSQRHPSRNYVLHLDTWGPLFTFS